MDYWGAKVYVCPFSNYLGGGGGGGGAGPPPMQRLYACIFSVKFQNGGGGGLALRLRNDYTHVYSV